jgi:hypothetical protein
MSNFEAEAMMSSGKELVVRHEYIRMTSFISKFFVSYERLHNHKTMRNFH